MTSQNPLQAFCKETLVNGQQVNVKCFKINGQTYSITEGVLKVVGLEDEWFDDVAEPESVINALTTAGRARPDIFSFWQRLPETEPKYPYYREWESLAVLPVSTYDHWFTKQMRGTARNMIRKSQKLGVEVKNCVYDDDFVRGITEIFNETPIRQGRRFWHYGKDFDVVKRQFSRFLFREDLIGAYCGSEMVGFAMVGNAGKFALLGQFLSKMKHRDKAINNALMAQAVKVCEMRGLSRLVYGYWDATSLGGFKQHSGFGEVKAPRYFVPLTPKGKLALKLGVHNGLKAAVPRGLKDRLRKLRRLWLENQLSKPAA